MTEYSSNTHFLHSDQLHRETSLAWRTTLIYGYRNTSFKSMLILCPFSRIIVGGEPQIYSPRYVFPAVEWVLKSIRKWQVTSRALPRGIS